MSKKTLLETTRDIIGVKQKITETVTVPKDADCLETSRTIMAFNSTPNQRQWGTDSLTNVYKAETPGQVTEQESEQEQQHLDNPERNVNDLYNQLVDEQERAMFHLLHIQKMIREDRDRHAQDPDDTYPHCVQSNKYLADQLEYLHYWFKDNQMEEQ